MLAFCPLCASDEWTTHSVAGDGRRFAICENDREHGPDGYVWEPSDQKSSGAHRSDGLGHELGIWDKLLDCIPDDEAFHSYGDVEDAFFDRYRSEAHRLQSLYGHRWRDGQKSKNQYSMSVYLALRLRELEKEQLLDVAWLPAEGEWAYNGIISHWRHRSRSSRSG